MLEFLPFLPIFTASFLIAAVASPFVMKALIALKSRQTIHSHAPETHQVKQGTPTMGGLMILLGAIPSLVYASQTSKHALPILELLVGFGLIGFIDDYVVPRMLKGKRGLGWIPKLLMQIGIGLLALWTSPLRDDPLALGFGLFIILFYTNAYNFSDGLDGLAASLGIILCFGFAILSGGKLNLEMASLLGPMMVFLFWNAAPAKVFMGDVGALAIGAAFGYAFLVCVQAGTAIISPYLIAPTIFSIVMLAEIVPVPMQIFWVKVFKKKLFPYTPIHHAFEKAGWPETRVVAMFSLAQLLCLVLAIGVQVRR